ncbi:MAG: hypothetical protein KAJ98_13960 [Spirochaetaceae bacterium]|nr:hypothetical protein [Spirochaetaceae bacterium]
MDRLAEEGIDFTRAYTPCSLYSPARASMLTGKWHVGTETGPGDYGREGLSLPGYGNVRESGEFRTYLEADNLANHPVPGDMNRSRGGLQDKESLYEDVMPPLLVFSAPGISDTGVRDEPVGNMDIMPR